MQSRKTPWAWIITSGLFLFLVAFIGFALIAMTMSDGDSSSASGPRVGVIEVSGAIMDEGAGGPLNRSRGARDVIEELEKARKDPSVKAVVIRVNSPGGSAAASQEMYQAVRELGKPVVCSMGDVAASGGYYIAAACDEIYANGSTLTGSIGVISQFMNYKDLFKKVGLDTATIKSGKFKDAGNPARDLTPEERQLFQQMINDVYQQFIDDVAAGRKGKLTRAQLLKLADGRVYTGRQAKNNKLIDHLGGLQDAIAAAAKRGGISGEPKVKEFGSGGLFGSMFGAEAESAVAQSVASAGAAAGDAAGKALVQSLQNSTESSAVRSAPQMR